MITVRSFIEPPSICSGARIICGAPGSFEACGVVSKR
jgi:hypothetical protein